MNVPPAVNGTEPEMEMGVDYSLMYSFLGCDLGFDMNDMNSALPLNLSLCNFGPIGELTDTGEFDVLQELPFRILVIVLYTLVILVGAIGNSLVVLTIIKTRQMWNATNIFIANLALSDVFVCVFDLPISAYYQITDDWIFGEALCHIIPCSFAVVVFASTLTLTLIAVDRYVLIVYPLKRRLSVCTALLMIVVIAMISIAIAAPIALYSKYVVIDDPMLNLHKRYCTEKWPSPKYRTIYTISTLVLQYFLPLVLIAILYMFIFNKVRKRITKAKSSRKTRTTKMLVAVVAVFAVAWTPFHLYAIIGELDYDLVRGKYYKLIDLMLRVFAMSSSCINPLLYGWMNDNYRNAFQSIVRRNIGPISIHREDSDETTRKSLVQTSPVRKTNRVDKLANGKMGLHVQHNGETVAMTTLVVNGNEHGRATSPLLRKLCI